MKIKRFLFVAMIAIMLVVLAGCNSVGFMKDSVRDNLVKTYGTPQAEMVVEYQVEEVSSTGETETKTVKLTIKYDLLLDKAPITVVNFINLVNQGYYNAVKADDGSVTSLIFDNQINTNTGSWIAGRYTHTLEADGDKVYREAKALDYTIYGEFVQNGYVLPKPADVTDEEITDSNARFSMFSLAMYHEANVDSFNSASSAFFLTTKSEKTENYKNYAVFAELNSITVEVNGVKTYSGATVPSEVIYDFDKTLNATSNQTIYGDDGDGTATSTETILTNLVRIVSIKMVDGKDYSGLPTNYVIR